MRVGYLGPEGTFTHEALLGAATAQMALVALPTIYDAVVAVEAGELELALVPIENSLEGSVNATLDALAFDADEVVVVGELVHPISHCLVARRALELREIETVISHPQANAQCARFIRAELPQATVLAGSSTAEAVRTVAERDEPWAALAPRAAADRYGCVVLKQGVEDRPGNETRFVWLGRHGAAPEVSEPGQWKTAIVFWGSGADHPGWLVSCLRELADRGVNLTRIESRPQKQGLGQYMFFADLEGAAQDGPVADALGALGEHVDVVRVLGSFPAA